MRAWCCGAVWLIFLVPLWGQEDARGKKEPPRAMRVWPVGDSPPFRQEVRGGVRYELEPPPGSIPPRKVAVVAGEKEAGETRLSLGRLSQPLAVPGGAGPLVLREAGEDGESSIWLQTKRPEKGDFIALLWRDPKVGNWTKARAVVLADSAAVAPAGTITAINLSPVKAALIVGGEKFVLEPLRPVRRKLAAGKPVPLTVGLADVTGKLRPVYSGAAEQGANERTWVVVYKADGVAPRRPVKVVLQRERVVPLEVEGER